MNTLIPLSYNCNLNLIFVCSVLAINLLIIAASKKRLKPVYGYLMIASVMISLIVANQHVAGRWLVIVGKNLEFTDTTGQKFNVPMGTYWRNTPQIEKALAEGTLVLNNY